MRCEFYHRPHAVGVSGDEVGVWFNVGLQLVVFRLEDLLESVVVCLLLQECVCTCLQFSAVLSLIS